MPTAQRAVVYAQRAHSGQRRQIDGAPYIQHPIEVVALLYHAGAAEHVIAAGALHDTIEKTSAPASELLEHFGPRIARLVCALTDDDQIADYGERKAVAREQAAEAGDEALLILAADKISKVRELQLEIAHARRGKRAIATTSRLQRYFHYRECLRLLDQRTDSELVTQLRAEIEKLPPTLDRHALAGTAA